MTCQTPRSDPGENLSDLSGRELQLTGRPERRAFRVLVDDDELVCQDAERSGFSVVRARWTAESGALKEAQEGEGRT